MEKLFEYDIYINDWRVLVQSHDIQNGAIRSQHIAENAIDASKIGDMEVEGRHIADLAITSSKIANDAVSTAKIENEAIEGRHIQNEAITTEKIAPGTLDGKTIALNSNFVSIDVEDEGDIVVYLGNGGSVQDVEIVEETGDVNFIIEG